jgi:hypothetical protein
MLVLSSVTICMILVQVLREFYFTVMEMYAVFSAVNDLMPEQSSTLG